MGLGSRISNMSRKGKIISCVIAAAVIAAVVVVCIVASRNNYLATTMRLLRIQGTVNIEDSKGGSKPVIDNLRFQSGDALNTGADGLASVGLDDTKIITLQNDSRAEFKKKRNQLELKLTKGAVFFNVTEKLRADETFEIKTSTMTAGIRGTSGIIYHDVKDSNRLTISVTDGTVRLTATNPDTSFSKTIDVVCGKTAKIYFYNDDGTHEDVEFEVTDINFDELRQFQLGWFAEDEELMTRISTALNRDKEDLKKIFKGLPAVPVPEKTPENPPEPEKPVTKPEEKKDPGSENPPENQPENPAAPPKNNKKNTRTRKVNKTKKKTTKTTTKKTTKKNTKKKKKTTKKKTSSSEPSVPSGYEKYVWGVSYNGHKVYIITPNNEEFKGYIGGKWVVLDPKFNETDIEYFETFYNGKSVYYKRTRKFADLESATR